MQVSGNIAETGICYREREREREKEEISSKNPIDYLAIIPSPCLKQSNKQLNRRAQDHLNSAYKDYL